MKNYHAKRAGISLSLLAGLFASPFARAQAVIYANPYLAGRSYGLLNSDHLALYINDQGDIGAPIRGGAAKPNGNLDSAGHPYINADGSVNTTPAGAANGTYGILANASVPAGLSLADSVRAKDEYLTIGSSSVAEGFALIGDDPSLRNGPSANPTWLNASDFTAQSFKTGAVSTTPTLVSQLFRQTGPLASQGLMVTQTVSLPLSNNSTNFSPNYARFDINFTNNDTQTLTGLRYARGLNPNEGASLATSTGDTRQMFGGNAADSTGFLINSSSGQRQLGLSVPTGHNMLGDTQTTNGARVTAANTHFEGSLLSNPDNFFGASSNYVTLNSGTSATYHAMDGSTQTTANFTSDKNFNPDFGATDNGDFGLLLESGTFSLQPGQTLDFTFFLETDPFIATVPEPGAFALLFAGLSVGLMARRRRVK